MQEGTQQHRAERIEALLQEVSTFSDPRVRAVIEELLQALLDMYGEGLARLLELSIQTETTGNTLLQTFANDDLISALLLLHDLHPVDIETRIVQALDATRPYLKAHGGNVQFVSIVDGVAHLRLEGSCHGCSASTLTLKSTLEEAIYKAAPDLDGLEVEGVVDPPPQPERVAAPVTFMPRKKSVRSVGWHSDDA